MDINDQDRVSLLRLARDTLHGSFSDSTELVLKNFEGLAPILSPVVSEKHPCFVTLLKGEELQGCIGSLTTKIPLYQNVWEKTQQAAFHDPRFAPVKESELPEIKFEISILFPSIPLPSLDLVEIGRHGLVVQSGNRKGVLLAKVAVEYDWDAKEFLAQTCLKAGLAPELVEKYQVSYFEEVSF